MKTLSIDIETYSDQPLAKTGVYRYVESPVFEILLFSYSADGGPVQLVDLACGEKIPTDILAALEDDSVTKWAFNASFERICLSRYLGYPTGEYLAPDSWKCSMVWAATMGLPLSLEGVGAVLGLEKQKLTEGKELIKYFCQPCAPTKSNGQRTRNLPAHAPDKWLAFKKYNIRDVETEMAIQARLSKFPVPDSVWDEYHLDQEINDRGVGLDMELVRQAIQMDGRSRSELTHAMKELTALDNPNSVQQMKQWLSDNGLETDTLGKKAVAEMLKTAPPELQTVLTLRQQLAKSSVKKYQAMETAVCADGRARGMFQFYGANRTGRWAGRIIQMQNLPQNHLNDLSEARSLVRSGDFEAVEMLYEDVPDTLSQLIRTAFVPQNGRKFIVADFSAIEARVIAWLAGETWRQEVFAEGKDIYCASASQMFGVPVEKHGINGHLRQKGKIAELALGYNVILIIDQMEGVLVEFQVNHTALVVDGSGRAIFNCLSHIIDVDVITEDLSCTAVFCGDRCSGESNVGRIRKRVSYNAGSADNGFRLDFAVVLLLNHNLLIETILPTMRFISHHDNVPTLRKSFVAFFKLLHGREDYAVCLSVCKQLFQIFTAFGVLRRLTEKVFAAGELSVKLVIQIVTVGNDDDSGAF